MAWFGLFDDKMDLDSFFKQYFAGLTDFYNSFNKDDFPNSTLLRIDVLVKWKSNHNSVIIHGENMRVEVQDFLMDMESKLLAFKNELQMGSLVTAAQRKDFVTARKVLLEQYFKGIKNSYTNSALANFKSFQTILYLLGP